MLVQQLSSLLPNGFVVEPRVHLGTYFEVDIGAFEAPETTSPGDRASDVLGIAAEAWASPQPTLTIETDLSEPSEYEVLIYDADEDRRLVAAVEFVIPANKDRPEHRRAFVAKCAALIQRQVCVAIVDVVTVRQFNLYADLLELIDRSDPALGVDPPSIYAVTCRSRKADRRPLLDTWLFPLQVGLPLPALPLWLGEELRIPLALEPSYEQTCRALRIP